jgi:hypothetical protein
MIKRIKNTYNVGKKNGMYGEKGSKMQREIQNR